MERLRESDLSSSRIPLLFGNILEKCLENRPGDVFPPILKWGSLLRPGRGGKFRLKLTPEGVAEAGKSLGQEHNLRSIIFLDFSSVCLHYYFPANILKIFLSCMQSVQTLPIPYLVLREGYINNWVVSDCWKIGLFLTHFLGSELFTFKCFKFAPSLITKQPFMSDLAKKRIWSTADLPCLLGSEIWKLDEKSAAEHKKVSWFFHRTPISQASRQGKSAVARSLINVNKMPRSQKKGSKMTQSSDGLAGVRVVTPIINIP